MSGGSHRAPFSKVSSPCPHGSPHSHLVLQLCCPSCFPSLYILHILRAPTQPMWLCLLLQTYWVSAPANEVGTAVILPLLPLHMRKLRKEGGATIGRSAPRPSGHSCPRHEPLHRTALPSSESTAVPALGNASSLRLHLFSTTRIHEAVPHNSHRTRMGWSPHASPQQMWAKGLVPRPTRQRVWCCRHRPALQPASRSEVIGSH